MLVRISESMLLRSEQLFDNMGDVIISLGSQGAVFNGRRVWAGLCDPTGR
jgi:hypothetical protein